MMFSCFYLIQLTIGLLFCRSNTYAKAIDVADVSSSLEIIRAQSNVPGLLSVVFKNDQLLVQGVAGFRRYDNTSPFLISDMLNIGSCSKWMTATLAGRLVDRKLISWSTQIREYFPNYSSLNSAFRNATLEQLLAHRAGIQQSTTFNDLHGVDFLSQQGNVTEIRRWVAETVLRDAPEIMPGEYLYSNPSYTVAAAMMEQATGRDWESLINEHIFVPLNMTSAKIGPVYDDILPPKAPVGHSLIPNHSAPIPHPLLSSHILHIEQASTGPGGFIACTITDFGKFLHAHSTAETTGYLTRETAAKLKRPFVGAEGYGLGVMAYNRTWALPGQALVHDGDAFGHNIIFWMAPTLDLIAVAFTNCRSAEGLMGPVLDAAIGVVFAKYNEIF